MQKHYSLLLAFLVAVSSLFVSCDENDNDLNPTICKITVVSDGDGAVSITNYVGTFANVLIGNNVEAVATPAEGSAFIGWYVGGSTIPVSTDKRFVFTASENITLIAKFTKLSNLTLCSAGYGSVSFKDSADASVAVLPGSEVTVVATPDEDCDFIGWFIGEAEEPVSIDAEYTFTVTVNLTLTAKFKKRKTDINGYEYVDLALPSGLKWATMNVGATSPEDYGGYYAWGETEEKEYYEWSIYKWHIGSPDTMTKYCTDSYYGTVDNKTVLDPEDDVAHVTWGSSWRMPTKAEQDELRNNCTWTWATQNGVDGYKVTGPNGNSIFLPAAGFRDGTGVCYRGSSGYYWSSSLYSDFSPCAYDLYFRSGHDDWYYDYYRYSGRSVRPVSK